MDLPPPLGPWGLRPLSQGAFSLCGVWTLEASKPGRPQGWGGGGWKDKPRKAGVVSTAIAGPLGHIK